MPTAMLPLEDDLVSVVMPAYKAAPFLEASVRSVLAQSYGKVELLLVEDCSPDNTLKVAETLSQGDPRIRVIRHAMNQGAYAARNSGIQAARGRWLAFLDADDLWTPDKLERQLAFMGSSGLGFSFTAYRFMTPEGQVGRPYRVPRRVDRRSLLGRNVIATSTVLLDRAQVGEVAMRKVYYDDFVCWLDTLERVPFAWGMDEELMFYRLSPGSLSRNKWKSAREVWKIYRTALGMGLLESLGCFGRYVAFGVFKYFWLGMKEQVPVAGPDGSHP